MAEQLDPVHEAMVEAFDEELAQLRLRGHWKGVTRREKPEGPRAQLWKWGDIYPNLMRAGELITLDETGRRTLQLITPGLDSTSPNIQMSVQLVLPGEVASAHRHMFAATRFVVKGHGAYTTVDGEPLYLSECDYVTTPGWCFHDHTNPMDEPIIWLDIHDNPLVGTKLGVRFAQRYPESAQPLTVEKGTARDLMGIVRRAGHSGHPAHQPAGYPWAEVEPALERAARGPEDPHDGATVDYINPVSGSHLLPTLGARVQMLRAGARTQPHRHTSYTIYHVVRGEGATIVGDQRLEWAKGDCFTLPSWEWHSHEALGGTEAVLFSVHDQPVLEAFDLYREQADDEPDPFNSY